jgi:hypothetical protein
VRLTVDGVRVIDRWIDQSPTTYRTTLDLDGGPHHVTMEYYENGGGAVAKLAYTKVGEAPALASWHASFWNTPEGGIPDVPTRVADLQRDDPTLDFDWGEGAPGAGIANDHFVGRWTKSVMLSAGLYRFSGGRDDGIRVYLDNEPLVDHWTTGNEDFSVEKVVSGAPTTCALTTSSRAAARAPSSRTSGSATSCRPVAPTTLSTSPTAPCRGRRR